MNTFEDLKKIKKDNIEVELRSFISKDKYNQLLDFFKKNSKIIKEDFEETNYLDLDKDLRIQKNNNHSKIWLKKGKIHDEAREETEVIFDKEDFDKIKKIFNEIGFDAKIKWLRYRYEFIWDNIKVCLDYTKGYGYILELEIMASENNKDKAIDILKEKFKELNINITSKEEFNNRYEYYKNNWEELVNNEN